MRARVVPTVLGALLALCCAHRAPNAPPSKRGSAPVPALPSPLEEVRSAHRPSVRLLSRNGDPTGAVALVVATGAEPRAAAALAGLVELRLGRRAAGAQVRVHALGFAITTPAASGSVSRWVDACAAALLTPVKAAEVNARPVRARLDSLRALGKPGRHGGAALACAGEAFLPDAVEPTVDARTLEQWRAAAATATTVAFGAVGSRELLRATSRAVAKGDAWPTGNGARDPWPEGDVIGADPQRTEHRLSLAWRVGDPTSAATAAELLGRREAPLALRLAALDADWSVQRVVATARPSGGCLLVELEGPREGLEPSLDHIARLAALAADEGDRALAAPSDGGFARERSILAAADPRAAAQRAAWGALTEGRSREPTRRVVAYATPAVGVRGEAGTASTELARALATRSGVRGSLSTPRVRVEHGQGELWALLASPCGTAGEGAATAGYRALLLRTLARARDGEDGVGLEPWITPDGVGLLAHAPRQRTDETPAAHAARVGGALGRALAVTRLDGVGLAAERARLSAEIGPGPRPDWWLLIDALAPDHPSWLEPRGTFGSIDLAGTEPAASERRQLLGEPLRLAVLASWDKAQVASVVAGVNRWLGPAATGDRRCSAIVPAIPASTTLDLTSEGSAEHTVAHLAFPLGAGLAGQWSEAEIARWLLAREDGWLQQALAGLSASAHVELLGGRRLGALVVSLEATAADRDRAVSAATELMSRIATTPPDRDDVALALRTFAARAKRGSYDPRRRIVDLWRGERRTAPSAESLQRFLAGAFTRERLVLVRTGSTPGGATTAH
jgi:hypothetical protein